MINIVIDRFYIYITPFRQYSDCAEDVENCPEAIQLAAFNGMVGEVWEQAEGICEGKFTVSLYCNINK